MNHIQHGEKVIRSLCHLPEDKRIEKVIEGLNNGKQVGVVVESDKVEMGKARRYAEKIRNGFTGPLNIKIFRGVPDERNTSIVCKPLAGNN